jgi:hypothetical protein
MLAHQFRRLRRLDQLGDDPDRQLHRAADLAGALQPHAVDRLGHQIDQKPRIQPGLGDRPRRWWGMQHTHRSHLAGFAQRGHCRPRHDKHSHTKGADQNDETIAFPFNERGGCYSRRFYIAFRKMVNSAPDNPRIGPARP